MPTSPLIYPLCHPDPRILGPDDPGWTGRLSSLEALSPSYSACSRWNSCSYPQSCSNSFKATSHLSTQVRTQASSLPLPFPWGPPSNQSPSAASSSSRTSLTSNSSFPFLGSGLHHLPLVYLKSLPQDKYECLNIIIRPSVIGTLLPSPAWSFPILYPGYRTLQPY